MSLFDFIKRLIGMEKGPECPQCGYGSSWDGKQCGYCHYVAGADAPASTENRTYDRKPLEAGSANTANSPTAKETSLGGLDTDKFAPISTEQALELTKSGNWRTAYLDSLWVIPPADLPRIRVIDQTMVGLGLISAEELAQIHFIGEEFAKYKSAGQQIQQAGAAAVAQSRQERVALKQQKKEEAAARKQAHAEAVAERKATDIVFLGRGVSKGLADRKSHIERLNELGLPVLATPSDLSKALDVSIPQLKWLAFHTVAATQVHYFSFMIPKKSGGQRKLLKPHQKLSDAQRWIFENVLRKVAVHEAANGFVPERSIVTNAQPHVGADVVVNVDLKDFFPTINFWRVDGLFRSLGYSPAVATIMALLCTECPRQEMKYNGQLYHVATGPRALPQGSCTSPAISNLVSRNLDKRLSSMAKKLGWIYTRYADDITYSFKGQAPAIGYVLARLRHIADDEGFSINEKKTRVLGNHTRQSVTGIVVNDQMGVKRKTVRELRAILHNAKKTGLEAQNREGIPNFSDWLGGMISYVEMVNPKHGATLRRQFQGLHS